MSQKLSEKEREILARQKQLAAQLRKPPPPAPLTSSSTSTKPEQRGNQPPVLKSNVAVIKKTTTKATTASLSATRAPLVGSKPPSAAPPPAVPNKRPSKNRRGGVLTSVVADHPSSSASSSSSSSSAVLAAARAKVSGDGAGEVDSSSKTTQTTTISAPSTSTTTRPSPTLKRKTLTGEGGMTDPSSSHQHAASSLAKLVQHAAASSTGVDGMADPMAASSLPTVTPDDYWKNLRDWDLVSQFYHQQQSTITASALDDDNYKTNRKPLPDIFLNARHYVAAWAPLCMAECRAQILQEVSSSIANNHAMTRPVLVRTEVTNKIPRHRYNDPANWSGPITDAPWLDENETGVHIIIRPKDRHYESSNNDNNNNAGGGGDNMPITANDLFLLLQSSYRDVLIQIAKGGGAAAAAAAAVRGGGVVSASMASASLEDSSSSSTNNNNNTTALFQKVGLVGHCETSRSGLNGLILKVSRRKWAVIGQKEMYVMRLGSNITALREFTALCRMETLPMKRYLLGQHLEHRPEMRNNNKSSSHHHPPPPEHLLEQMGGSQALGHGFVDYARRKFNASQLAAIAAAAHEYGEGGFTLIKGPPGTGKTTTLVAVLNSLHIRQFNKYYEEVRRIAAQSTGSRQNALEMARRAKPRLLVCAPSNAAVDNIILKIMEDGFVDGKGQRYNPSMIRVGVGRGDAVRPVALEEQVDAILAEHLDVGKLQAAIAGYRVELSRISQDIASVRRRILAIQTASKWNLSKDWEIRIHEDTFDESGRVYFVNHKDKTTTYEQPPPPEPDEVQFPATSMPEYRVHMARVVKLVESYFSVKSHLERCSIIKATTDNGAGTIELRQELESHVLNSVHLVMTTLGTAGSRTLEQIERFEVVVVDEAAQSVEPASLSALQLGQRHAILVGDPQQLPATIFNVSGRNSKYDRSLFQRLEEAGSPVHMLNEQYRMHPKISHFPRHIFYGGALQDGVNVRKADYGDPLLSVVCRKIPALQPFTILNLDSREERGGTSLSNSAEAKLAVFLFQELKVHSRGLSTSSRVAVITPYAQQCKLLRQFFSHALGPDYANYVEVNTVDAFQGREANIVIFSAVRASGNQGIGFLADVRRMNVALTRAKYFLFVIARCESIVVNPYWKDLVDHAKQTRAVLRVPIRVDRGGPNNMAFGDLTSWRGEDIVTTGGIPNHQWPPENQVTNPSDGRIRIQNQDPRKRKRDG